MVQPVITWFQVDGCTEEDCQSFPRQRRYKIAHNLDVVDMIENEDKIISAFVEFVWLFMIDTDFKDRISIELIGNGFTYGQTISYLKENFRVESLVEKLGIWSRYNGEKRFMTNKSFEASVTITRSKKGVGKPFKRKHGIYFEPQNQSKRSVTEIHTANATSGYWAIACILAKKTAEDTQEWKYIQRNRAGRLEKAAKKLCSDCGLDYNENLDIKSMEKIDKFIKPRFQLVCVNALEVHKPVFVGGEAPDQVCIVIKNDKFDAITGTLAGYTGSEKFCVRCWLPGTYRAEHWCL